MGDEATTEALRKLDGVSGKSMRARASISSIGRIRFHSRLATPGTSKNAHPQTHARGEGEVSARDFPHNNNVPPTNTSKESDKLDKETPAPVSTGVVSDGEGNRLVSSDELPVDKDAKKTSIYGASLSFTAKRGSVSSTTYTGTQTTSSWDSGSMSTTTAATSVSGRTSGKARRNSTNSDVSSLLVESEPYQSGQCSRTHLPPGSSSSKLDVLRAAVC